MEYSVGMAKKPEDRKNVYITIRVEEKHRQEMQKIADEEYRTIANVGARIIKEYFEGKYK